MSIPHFEKINGKKVLFVHDRPVILSAGEIHNSSSSSPERMETLWYRAEALGMNALLIPVTWQMIEPEEGSFDFTLTDALIDQARRRGGHLGILWFGSWKNGECMYAPEWVKRDMDRFPRAEVVKGKNRTKIDLFGGLSYSTLSYLGAETLKADSRAFSALMRHLREKDGDENTVVYVQVENESGVMGAVREHSDLADEVFAGPVPASLAEYLRANTGEMDEDLKHSVEGGMASGTWSEVFGESAEEVFSAYHVASYINAVAAAGKAEYRLPMVVNCWLKQGPAGSYPTGGPIHQMMEVWECAAPEIEAFCPDIYVQYFLEVCDSFVKRGNPLFIPETANNGHVGSRLVYAVGNYHAACFAPFAYEEIGDVKPNPFAEMFGGDSTDPLLKQQQDIAEYRMYSSTILSMTPMLAAAYGTGRLQAAIAERGESASMEFTDIGFTAQFPERFFPKKDGVCLILEESPECFYILANRVLPRFYSVNPDKPDAEILSLEEGYFENGEWKRTLLRNGDELNLMAFEPVLYRLRIFVY